MQRCNDGSRRASIIPYLIGIECIFNVNMQLEWNIGMSPICNAANASTIGAAGAIGEMQCR